MSDPGPPSARARKLVVAGLIVGDDGTMLISQRPPGGPLAGKWEFPGGKIEAGEPPDMALVRELEEELGCVVQVGRVWDVLWHPYPDFDLLMLVYPCRVIGPDAPRCREVAALAWVNRQTIADYDILVADRPLVERIRREGPPSLEPWVGSLPAGPNEN